MNSEEATVSVIMPVYNLEHKVEKSLKYVKKVLDKENLSYEIIVVDDGSRDGTYHKALNSLKKLPSNNIRVVRISENKGKGYALLYGFKKSRGNIVVFFDGDLDIDPRQIPLLVNVLKKTNADVVITSKWHPLSRTEASKLRKFLSLSFYSLTKLLLNINVSDTQTGAKAFKRRVLERIIKNLTIKRYAFDVELIVAILSQNFKIVEVPALWKIVLKSRFKVKEIIKMFIDLLAITYRYRILKQYTVDDVTK